MARAPFGPIGTFEYKQYAIFNINKKNTPIQFIQNLQLWDFSKGLKNELETAVVNEQSGSSH